MDLRNSRLHKEAMAYVVSFESGKKWMANLTSSLTKKRYAKSLYKYCKETKRNPDELIQMKIEGIKHAGEPIEFQCEDLLEGYFEKVKLAYNGKLMMKHAIISFYKRNRRPLAPDVAEKWVQLAPEPEIYRIPDIKDIEMISENCQGIRDKALTWFIESTSMRRGTIPRLTWGDLREIRNLPNGEIRFYSIFDENKEGELDKTVPLYVAVPSTKLKGKYKGVQQHTFVHFVAYKYLMQYQFWREQGRHFKETIDSKTPLFACFKKPHGPLMENMVWNIIINASILAFQNGKIYTPHDLRRFTQTMLEKAKLSSNWILKITGKALKGEQAPYSLPKIVELFEAYKSAINNLVPPTEKLPTHVEVRQEIHRTKREMEERERLEIEMAKEDIQGYQEQIEVAELCIRKLKEFGVNDNDLETQKYKLEILNLQKAKELATKRLQRLQQIHQLLT